MTKIYKNKLREEQVNAQASQPQTQTQVQQTPAQPVANTQATQQSGQTVQTQPIQANSQPAQPVNTQPQPVQKTQPQQNTTTQTADNTQDTNQAFVSSQPTNLKAVVPQNQKWLSIITDPEMQNTICNYQGVISNATVDNGKLLIESNYKEKSILESLEIRLPRFMERRLTEATSIPTSTLYMQIDPYVQGRLGRNFGVTKIEGTNQGIVYTNQLGQTKLQKFCKDGMTLSKNINWLNKEVTQQPQEQPQADTKPVDANSEATQTADTSTTTVTKEETADNNTQTQNNEQQQKDTAKKNTKTFASGYLNQVIKNMKGKTVPNTDFVIKDIKAGELFTEKKETIDLTPKTGMIIIFEFDKDTTPKKDTLSEEIAKFFKKFNKNSFTLEGVNFIPQLMEINQSSQDDKQLLAKVKISSTAKENINTTTDKDNNNNNDYMNYVKARQAVVQSGDKKALKKFDKRYPAAPKEKKTSGWFTPGNFH